MRIAHTQFFASFMTFQGTVKSITRYIRRNQSGALSRAAFEEPVDMLVAATINGEVDDLSGCSSAIICRRAPKVGANGSIDLLVNSKQSKTSYPVNQRITLTKKACDFGISSFDKGSNEEPQEEEKEEDEEDYIDEEDEEDDRSSVEDNSGGGSDLDNT